MSKYKLVIDVSAWQDILEITDWYNQQSAGLGTRFQKQVKLQINSLKNYALSYSTRYLNVRCMMVKKFPFLVHFIVDDKHYTVEIFAIIHTSRKPKVWEKTKDI